MFNKNTYLRERLAIEDTIGVSFLFLSDPTSVMPSRCNGLRGVTTGLAALSLYSFKQNLSLHFTIKKIYYNTAFF